MLLIFFLHFQTIMETISSTFFLSALPPYNHGNNFVNFLSISTFPIYNVGKPLQVLRTSLSPANIDSGGEEGAENSYKYEK